MALLIDASNLSNSEFGVIITVLPGDIARHRLETAEHVRANLIHDGFISTGIRLDDDVLPASRHFPDKTLFMGKTMSGYRFPFGVFGCTNGGTYFESEDGSLYTAHVPDLRESRKFVSALSAADKQLLLDAILAKFEELM